MEALTGRAHTVNYRLVGSEIPLTGLENTLPDALFTLREDGHLLICQYSDSTHDAEHVNTRVLRVLLDHNIGVIEVHRGTELESAYLNHNAEY